MTSDLKNRIKHELLAAIGLSEADIVPRQHIEQHMARRELSDTALVTRVAPSPTGFLHIGTIYAALVCQKLARQSGGVYFLRVEDTDKKREIEGGVDLLVNGLISFDLQPDEGPKIGGDFGPYLQSERKLIYLAYALDLLDRDLAYPCFATPEELEQNIKKQQASKLRPGYYGDYALWRNKTDQEVDTALNEGKKFILRFKSSGSHLNRVEFIDKIKGEISLPENDLDIPLIKGDGSGLPTYHLAHIVDDYLMQTNLVLRGDEWLPSTPLHIELARAFGLEPFTYAHIAPITIHDKNGGGKRKLSKRKDPEANVAYFYEMGYPIIPLKKYLLGLANSDFDSWNNEHPTLGIEDFALTFEKLSKSRSPLYDIQKLNDYSKNYIASLDNDSYKTALLAWLNDYGVAFCSRSELNLAVPGLFVEENQDYLLSCFSLERSGEKVRKDVAKYSDVIEEYGYFLDSVFEIVFKPRITDELKDFKPDVISTLCDTYLSKLNLEVDQQQWFETLKQVAELCGFATDNKEYKRNKERYNGAIADAAKIIRVKLTGKNRTPDLYELSKVMGLERVKTRLT